MSETNKKGTKPEEASAAAETQPEATDRTAEPEEVDAAVDAEAAEEAEAAAEPDDSSPWAGKPPEDEAGVDQTTEERDLEAEIAEANDRLLRALAENENLRRRSKREREETARFAIASFARDVLSVADNLRRALEAVPGDPGENEALGSLVGGIELTERELAAIFERHGIERIDPAGEKFDHNLHEAMFEVPTADAEPGTVVQVFETGYVLNGRLLRAARVGIARALPEAPETVPETPAADTDTTA
ncbi:MAG: nucleotide exchange factor GrpE [Defluviicoccus sp.]|nr:nucleotide exchange factor GrpE [Defluviicoccus sp.]MDE0382550.1 nucleotide exchange factor GrpE [Defluviicoccus sp.]